MCKVIKLNVKTYKFTSVSYYLTYFRKLNEFKFWSSFLRFDLDCILSTLNTLNWVFQFDPDFEKFMNMWSAILREESP